MWRNGDMETYRHGHIDITQKGKTEAQTIFLICSQLAHHANGSLLFVRLLTKKQTEIIC
jgi:hypothetical protein